MFLYSRRCTTFNNILNIWILLTNKNVPLIYSITFCQQKTKDGAPSASKMQYRFMYLIFAAFHNLSPLHNFVWNKQSQVGTSKEDLDQGMAVKGFMQCSHWMLISALLFFISIILHEKQERFWTLVANQDADRQQVLKIFWEIFFADLNVSIICLQVFINLYFLSFWWLWRPRVRYSISIFFGW